MPLWYFSFANADLPKGSQFLGVAIVEAETEKQAISETWKRGINPGGGVVFIPIPEDVVVPIAAQNRLLNRAEVETFFGPTDQVEGPG